ncbi:adapter molecule Crk-like [Limulus polyphemus]|uniref:Adapter molecule Crk-like n=1 Tax=Limulus polyphemus TaxID=6850 RepID=A0ABM1BUU0_LIMPO|nr:adapter molecule Crk-like [Limulus polyphemus]XP_013789103.1 adapter molecule Crk-like [Limulus polyphemus]XP_013789104.1 adapter molecule Crk-like [Limulus polyphemus]XP_013789105.1 adapter molecule Crk-like [Limulus polyphemus]XP_022257208.1 adapter molecule Crk-like [Limulus polyphemus]
MAGSFDPYDKNSWFVGPMTRQEATDLLMAENEAGIFIVRNSSTIQGDLVLCVREDNKVSHYIINKIQQGDQTRFRIGDQMFPDIPSLLNFYKLHYLDTTPLIRPAERKVEKVRAKYDFTGSGDADDLPFKKGEILTIISKDEEQWWTARNSVGLTGSIPVPYVEKYDENQIDGQNCRSSSPSTAQSGSSQLSPNTRSSCERNRYNTPNIQRKLPALAKVKQARVPNAYDKTALKLEVGDVIKVTKMNINGQWEGELRGKTGHFPFTHVEFIDSENSEDES